MGRHNRYPNMFVVLILTIVFSIMVAGQSDTRLHMGGGDDDYLTGVTKITSGTGEVYEDQTLQVASLTEAKEEEVSSVQGEQDSAVHHESEPEGEKPGDDSEQQKLRIAVEPPEEEEVQVQEKRIPVMTHTVRAGETLSDIAKTYGITVNTILASNDIANPNRIRVGQQLNILGVNGALHTVANGETLSEIADRYRVSLAEIVEENNIADPGRIQPGTKIVIPGATRVMPRDALVVGGQLQRAFDWPLRGRLSSPFGMRTLMGTRRMHNGIDIAVPIGTPIRAAADGRVTLSGANGGYGIMVIIDHGNKVETRYAHNSRNVVKAGERVERGQIIAYSGNTGNSTGPHLHFEIRYRGTPVDPQIYLR